MEVVVHVLCSVALFPSLVHLFLDHLVHLVLGLQVHRVLGLQVLRVLGLQVLLVLGLQVLPVLGLQVLLVLGLQVLPVLGLRVLPEQGPLPKTPHAALGGFRLTLFGFGFGLPSIWSIWRVSTLSSAVTGEKISFACDGLSVSD